MTLQQRFGQFEVEARGRIQRVLSTGNVKLRELDEVLARVSRDDWTIPGLRRQLDELRARADSLRANAVKRVSEMPATAVSALATGTRTPIQNLARGLAEMAKRLEPEHVNGAGSKPTNGA